MDRERVAEISEEFDSDLFNGIIRRSAIQSMVEKGTSIAKSPPQS